jgi:superfamily II DNA or RNA helicase
LEEAIEAGILAPFNYYPLGYVLNADDRRRMKVVFGRRTQRAKAGNPMSDEEFWRELARIHKTSHAKLPIFDAFINEHRELLENTIIFVETKEYGDEVLKIVHKYRHDFHTYYGEEDSSVLRQFAKGDISCLITCHRLSEGIDIRSLETVILFASARGKLETIQRIGRCLRADPNNPEKCANVVDFIRDVVPDEHEPEADLERSAWLTHLSSVRPKV